MKASLSIEINELNVYNKVDLEDYQKLIEKLIYLTYKIRFKIAFIVRKLSKYYTDPKKNYLSVTKRVIRYFNSIIYQKLMYK